MNKDEFIEKIKEIGSLESDVEMRTALAELSDKVTPIFDQTQELEQENNKYKEDNEKLRSANMQLFLRVGSQTPAEAQKENTGIEPEKPPRKYEDLFDSNGNLKL